MKRVLLATLLSSNLLLSSSAVAQEQPIPPTLLQRIRQLLGLVQPVAAGGSRGFPPPPTVCLVSPVVNQKNKEAIVTISSPVILTTKPLNELRIEQNENVLWEKKGSSTEPLKQRTSWPLRPIKPGEVFDLSIRPQGASGGDFARFQLRGAEAEVMQKNQDILEKLQNQPGQWSDALEAAIKNGDQTMVIALLVDQRRSSDLIKKAQDFITNTACHNSAE